MQIGMFAINLTSDQPDALKSFYRDTLGLPNQAEMGDGAFAAGPATIFVDGHSDTKGPAKEPQRVLVNFFVEDLDGEQARLKGKGVKFTREKGQEPWGGFISTFLDPDGNYLQLFEYKPA